MQKPNTTCMGFHLPVWLFILENGPGFRKFVDDRSSLSTFGKNDNLVSKSSQLSLDQMLRLKMVFRETGKLCP